MFINSNKKRISIDAPYVSKEGTRYLNLRDPSIRVKLGITEIPDPVRENEKFYYVQETDESPYIINTPKDIKTVKDHLLAQVKATAGSLLTQTDWKIVRAAEGVKEVDQVTLDYRKGIREASNSIEVEILNAVTLKDLEAVDLYQWPQEI